MNPANDDTALEEGKQRQAFALQVLRLAHANDAEGLAKAISQRNSGGSPAPATSAAEAGLRRYPVLHYAAAHGNPRLARLLLGEAACGAAVAARDVAGDTALHWAARGDHYEVAEVLLQHGAAAAAQNMRGQTALYVAALEGCIAALSVLLRAGGGLFVRALDGSSAVHAAVMGGTAAAAAVRLLAAQGADVAAHDEAGESPLVWAVREGSAGAVGALVEAGALDRTSPEERRLLAKLASTVLPRPLAEAIVATINARLPAIPNAAPVAVSSALERKADAAPARPPFPLDLAPYLSAFGRG